MMVARYNATGYDPSMTAQHGGAWVRYSDYANLTQLARDIEDSILSCEKGQTIYDVLANYRSVRRTILAIREAEKEARG